jgi:hypothetical protein
MKFLFFNLLFVFIVLPAFIPWLSHESAHALHDQQNHAVEDHVHDQHDHSIKQQEAVHHPIHVDVITYFSKYLNTDLHVSSKTVLKTAIQDTDAIDFLSVVATAWQSGYGFTVIKSRAPPDTLRLSLSSTPLYLSTQRLRI